MIKLFRNIRQRLVIENHFSKYLLYATGEIILVVIGILMAENLAPTLKGGFSKYHHLFYSVDIPLGIEGVRKGKNTNQ